MLWRDRGGRTRKKTNESQDLDLVGSPHKEEGFIVGVVDRDLLSLFPQVQASIIGGIERQQACVGQQWCEKLAIKVR